MRLIPKTANEKVMHGMLKDIARGYLTFNQMKKDAAAQGLSYAEYLEMVIENIKNDAARTIGVRPR